MSSETHLSELIPSPYFTSGFETASLFSSDAQTAFLFGNLFSEVLIPTPVPAHIRLPEYYTADQSKPPTPNFAGYPLRVDGITIYDPQNDPQFPILAERFITNNDLLSHKRKETELKRLQTPNLELKFEVKVNFQRLNPHPISHVSKVEHKTSPAPFEVVQIEFERDLNQPTLTYGKITFCNPYSSLLNILPLSKLYTIFYMTNLILYLHLFHLNFSKPITPSDTENYLPSDDPNITNLMVSHYDLAKQHNLRQFDLLNVKQCTEAPSDIQHANVKARVYVRAKAKRINAFKCVACAKQERKICFQGSVKYRRVDRTVWNHNTLPLPVTLDPMECKNIIRHLNGTNDKILNNLNYNKIFTLLEDHYFQERSEQYQTLFTVYHLNKMYTDTFIFMPAEKNWIYDPTRNPYHNCPAHHQFEVNLVS